MNGFWNRDGKDDMGGELGKGPTPPDELVRNISRRVEAERPKTRLSPRFAGASALSGLAVLALGVTGGLGAAANGVTSTAKSVFSPGSGNGSTMVEKAAAPARDQYGNLVKVGVCHLAGKAYVFVLVSPSSSLTLGRSTRDIVGVASAALCPKGGAGILNAKTGHLKAAVKDGTLTVSFTVAANKKVRSYEMVARRGNNQVRLKGTIAPLQKNVTLTFKIGATGKATVQFKTWIAGANVLISQIKT